MGFSQWGSTHKIGVINSIFPNPSIEIIKGVRFIFLASSPTSSALS